MPAKLWPLPIRELYGCGPRTAERLVRVGLRTIGDAANADPGILRSLLGDKAGSYIYESANGRSISEVHAEHEEAKSYSNELTTAEDVTADNFERIGLPILRKLSEKVAARLQRDGFYGKTVFVSVKTDSFLRRSRQFVLPDSRNDAETIFRTGEKLLRELVFGTSENQHKRLMNAGPLSSSIQAGTGFSENESSRAPTTGVSRNSSIGNSGLFGEGLSIRLIGIGMTNLDHGTFRQMSLEDYLREGETIRKEKAIARRKRETGEKLSAMEETLRRKFGEGSFRKGI